MSSPTSNKKEKKCVFFDMTLSNSAARIRLWLKLKDINDDTGTTVVETKLISSTAELQDPEYTRINPLKKVPAFITDKGLPLFESSVIMAYLEDRFLHFPGKRSLVLDSGYTPEDRAFVELMVRVHDLYICSANCTQPNFSHTQGCMYLDPTPTAFTPQRRTMDTAIRAAKLAELYQQLMWLETNAKFQPYLGGDQITHADLTWYPTIVTMELMLPRSFGWSESVFQVDREDANKDFPKISKWYQHCTQSEQHFAHLRQEFGRLYQVEFDKGFLTGVRQDVDNHPEYKWKYV